MEINEENFLNFEQGVAFNNEISCSKRSSTPFRQQKLPAWQPILTANTVLPWLLAIGVLFIPIGIFLINISNKIQEFTLDYTECFQTQTNLKCSELIKNKSQNLCFCEKIFVLNDSIDKNVYFYYALTNYYQNHRRYVRSRNDWQLLGYTNIQNYGSCIPFDKAIDFGKEMPIAPCGAIADSLFNDTFELTYLNENLAVNLIEDGISWPTDRLYKFKNPNPITKLKNFTHPRNWKIYLQDLKSGNSVGYENEHLIVWMRTAALPNFRKLYSKIDHSSNKIFENSLPKGKYKLKISYNYPVYDFHGTKKIILSNTSWLGGKNPFLGIAYLVTGLICILLVGILFIFYQKFGLRQNEMENVSVNTSFIFNKNL